MSDSRQSSLRCCRSLSHNTNTRKNGGGGIKKKNGKGDLRATICSADPMGGKVWPQNHLSTSRFTFAASARLLIVDCAQAERYGSSQNARVNEPGVRLGAGAAQILRRRQSSSPFGAGMTGQVMVSFLHYTIHPGRRDDSYRSAHQPEVFQSAPMLGYLREPKTRIKCRSESESRSSKP